MSLNAAVLGAGFIGSNFIRKSLSEGASLSVLDHKPCPEEYYGRVNWVEGDFSDRECLKSVISGKDVVYHFISSTVPGDDSDDTIELVNNVVQTLVLLKLCVEVGVKRIVFVSSSSVYGKQDFLPVNESAPTDPISSHGIHKLTIEKYLQLYQYQHGLECKIIRLSNPYGPGQSITGKQGFIAIAIGKLVSEDSIVIRGDGEDVRDYIYIDDACDALYTLGYLDTEQTVFNIGSGVGYSLNQVVSFFNSILGRSVSVTYIDSRASDIPISILDISRAKSALGYVPRVTLNDGLSKTLHHHAVIT